MNGPIPELLLHTVILMIRLLLHWIENNIEHDYILILILLSIFLFMPIHNLLLLINWLIVDQETNIQQKL